MNAVLAHPMPHPDQRVPRVSVLMPVYNGSAYLALALDSALAQNYRDFEIVLVDDGSTDTSGAIAARYQALNPEHLRVISQSNAGLPAARNLAMAAARGDYFALLDADDIWLPQHLQRAMDAFDEDPDLGLVHANICRIDAAGRSLGIPKRRWSREPDAYRALALRREHFACPTAVYARHCVDVVGGFDLQYTGLGCEDRDLWLRIAERYRCHYIDTVGAHYRVHPDGMSRQREKMAAARLRLLNKVAHSYRGADLYAPMLAMIRSDLGLELIDEGRWLAAMRVQFLALRTDPRSVLIWRRLLRSALQPVLARPAALTTGAQP